MIRRYLRQLSVDLFFRIGVTARADAGEGRRRSSYPRRLFNRFGEVFSFHF